ncbi:MAG: type II CAAX endopeptidase family protein, partial [Polyangiaceae bacterium]
EERPMTAVEATLWTIGFLVSAGIVYEGAKRYSPALAHDRGFGALSQLVVLGAIVALIRWVYFPKTPVKELLALAPGRWVFYPIAFLLGVAIQFPANGLYEAVLERWPAPPMTQEFAQSFVTLPLWRKVTAGVGLLVTTPLVEELFFRGALFGTLRRRHGNIAVVVMVSMLFALVHQLPQVMLPIGMVGAAIAFLRVASGSIWPGFVAHLGFNAVTFYVIATGLADSPEADEKMPVLWVIAGTVITAGLLALTDHLRPRDPSPTPPSEEPS